MSDTVLVALIAGVPSTLAALGAMWNAHKIRDVHLSLNSRLDQFLAVTKAQGIAEGKIEGQKDRA